MEVAAVQVPPLAPLVVLAFLGAGSSIFLLTAGAVVALVLSHHRLAARLGTGAVAVGALYGTVLAILSVGSRDVTLARGEGKVFCEIDCHLVYTVDEVSAGPTETLVTLRTTFDAASISPRRGDSPLLPNPRVVWVEDAAGRRLLPARVEAADASRSEDPLARALRPGESYITRLAFARPPWGPLRLFVGAVGIPEGLLFGHENSPGHGKVYFSLAGAM